MSAEFTIAGVACLGFAGGLAAVGRAWELPHLGLLLLLWRVGCLWVAGVATGCSDARRRPVDLLRCPVVFIMLPAGSLTRGPSV